MLRISNIATKPLTKFTRFSVRSITKQADVDERAKIVIVGSGWAGYRLARDLDKSKFNVKVVSPRNHFLFTPLLPSTAVGTLEFRAIQEPVRTIPNMTYYQANAQTINIENSTIHCTDLFKEGCADFDLKYDALILAVGSETNTFGIKGVSNNNYDIFYLKQLSHSRGIRNRMIDCFERASSPGIDEATIDRLLTFVVVGGGPTNIEFAAELYDFLKSDVSRWYPDLYLRSKVKVVELADHILGSFDSSLVAYVEKLFAKRNIQMLINTGIKSVDGHTATLTNGEELPFGMMVWSTGVKQVPMIERLSDKEVAKMRNGRIEIDSHLRVLRKVNPQPSSSGAAAAEYEKVGGGNVFAIGDCAGDRIKPLPPLAQVASQQGIYLAKTLNKEGLAALAHTQEGGFVPPFKYSHLGSMASVGEWKGVFDSTNIGDSHQKPIPKIKGMLAFFLWRAAYWTSQVSTTNKILIPMYWFKSMIFGRDISRF